MARNPCFCIDLRTAANQLTQIYDEKMAASGITVTQFSQLHLISSLNGPTLKELAAHSDLQRSTLGRNVRVLEKLGLVVVQVGRDARSRTIHLTDKGMNAFSHAVPLWQSMQSQLLERIGQSGRAQLDSILDTLTTPTTISS